MEQDLEQLRENWRRMSLRVDRLEADNRRMAKRLAAGRATSAQQKLAGFYRISAIASCLLPILAPSLTHVGFPVWIATVYAVFGVIMAILQFTFYRKIIRSDYLSLPVVTALADAIDIARKQRLLRMFSLCTGGFVILSMILAAFNRLDTSILIAMTVGLIIGAAIGYRKYRKMSALVREMQDELRANLNEETEE